MRISYLTRYGSKKNWRRSLRSLAVSGSAGATVSFLFTMFSIGWCLWILGREGAFSADPQLVFFPLIPGFSWNPELCPRSGGRVTLLAHFQFTWESTHSPRIWTFHSLRLLGFLISLFLSLYCRSVSLLYFLGLLSVVGIGIHDETMRWLSS